MLLSLFPLPRRSHFAHLPWRAKAAAVREISDGTVSDTHSCRPSSFANPRTTSGAPSFPDLYTGSLSDSGFCSRQHSWTAACLGHPGATLRAGEKHRRTRQRRCAAVPRQSSWFPREVRPHRGSRLPVDSLRPVSGLDDEGHWQQSSWPPHAHHRRYCPARTDLGLPLDEITLSDPRTAEQVVYKVASGTKGPRATSTGQLRETAHASVLVLSTGEKSIAQLVGNKLQEGARKRLVDVPAEVQPGSAFETIPPAQLHTEGKRLFDAMKRQHGAIGRAWQKHLVNLGPLEIKAQLDAAREGFLNLPGVAAV